MLGNGDAATDCENDEAVRAAYVDGNIQVNTKYISKYFNIDIYTEKQDLDYLGYQYFQTLLYEKTFQHLSYVVQENNVQVYSQRFLDLSNLSFFNFGQILRYYSIEEPPTLSNIIYMDGWYMKCQLKQSMKHTTE